MWLFQGKERKNNRRIIELLAQDEEPMIVYQIRERLGIDRKRYSTILYRVRNLEKAGILQKVGETQASKTHEMSSLFQLSPMGLVHAARSLQGRPRELAIERCRKRILGTWKKFTELYALDKVQTDWPAYQFFTEWLESDEGVLHCLDTQILTDEAEPLIAFRRMIDQGILLIESTGEFEPTSLDEREWKRWPYMMLAEIAIKHPELRKLHSTLREVDAPLYAHLKSHHVMEMVAFLSKAVPVPVAKKLATTPLFEEYTAGMIDRTRYYITSKSLAETLRDAKKSLGERKQRQLQAKPGQEEETALEDILAGMIIPIDVVVVEERRLTIVTEDPNQISPEWRQYCDIYHLDETGKVSVTKSETEATVGLVD